jgi:thiazole synthase ThiGH ThiG subunit
LANLFCAHADRRPVLCDAEIGAVRQVARQLADLGRNINQIAKKVNAAPDKVHMAADFELIRMLVDLETAAVKGLVKANLRGWGVSDGET